MSGLARQQAYQVATLVPLGLWMTFGNLRTK